MKWLKITFLFGLCLASAGALFVVSILFNASEDAKKALNGLESKIQAFNSRPTRIYSADGKLLYEVQPEYRERISLTEVPEHVRNAILAAEDHRFYQHEGVDYVGLGRAVVTNFRDRRSTQGGSTITMQLAKRLYSASEKSIQRKVQDIAIAIEMERQKSKDEILEMYLNQVYFGERAYGIAAAADIYFGKKVSDLTISEAAMLARCVQRPSQVNPVRNPQLAEDNRKVVLEKMRVENMISERDYREALASKPKIRKAGTYGSARIYRAPYFVTSILAQLDDLPLKEGGYEIFTTLDSQLQKIAEAEVRSIVEKNRWRSVRNAAFVLMDRDGRILAYVGGADFDRNKVDVVSRGLGKQPGSSFKPIVYATALNKGKLSEYDSVSNAKVRIKTGPGTYYEPKNSGGGSGGSMSLQRAFSASVNLPAVNTLLSLGETDQTGQTYKSGARVVVDTAVKEFGFRSSLAPYASLALGSSNVKLIEMAEAYSVFMLRGQRAVPFTMTRVVGPDGDLVPRTMGRQILSTGIKPEVCDVIDRLMRLVVTGGTGRAASIVPDARGKTGTTNSNVDAWFCGYSQGLIGIGWIGNEVEIRPGVWVPRPMSSAVYGGTVTVEMWAAIMKEAVGRFGVQLGDIARPKPRVEEKPEENVPNLRPDEEIPDLEVPAVVPNDPDTGPGTKPQNPPVEDPLKAPTEPTTVPTNPPKPTSEDADVDIEVCADSGAVATPYCNETITKRFKANARPRQRCPIHKGNGDGGKR